jgi:hypothetical protein
LPPLPWTFVLTFFDMVLPSCFLRVRPHAAPIAIHQQCGTRKLNEKLAQIPMFFIGKWRRLSAS